MVTLSELFRKTEETLSEYAQESARFETECIFEYVGISKLHLLTEPERLLSDEQEKTVTECVSRRAAGEPLQYILGVWEFYGFPFEVGEGVLIPRQDTATLVELAEQNLSHDMLCADLCAGSGCIGISLARLCGSRFMSYELSDKAFGYLERNIEKNGVSGLVKPVFRDVLSEETVEAAPELDAILTNPPYLTGQDMRELQPEVQREPEMALFGGEDGLDYYRAILAKWTKKLKSGGLFAAEIGCGQEKDVMLIFEQNGIPAKAVKDCCGIYRVVYGIKP